MKNDVKVPSIKLKPFTHLNHSSLLDRYFNFVNLHVDSVITCLILAPLLSCGGDL